MSPASKTIQAILPTSQNLHPHLLRISSQRLKKSVGAGIPIQASLSHRHRHPRNQNQNQNQNQQRTYSSTASLPNNSNTTTTLSNHPSPPRLPKEDQDLFESLQRESTGAFSTPRTSKENTPNQKADPPPPPSSSSSSSTTTTTTRSDGSSKPKISKGEDLHPNVRRGATPEFDGDTNPKTGEMGGPKNEPLRWGAGGEWSYNGRTTDF